MHVKHTLKNTSFYDFDARQNTGTHTVNLAIAEDFYDKEYVHNSIDEFCKGFINDKFNYKAAPCNILIELHLFQWGFSSS